MYGSPAILVARHAQRSPILLFKEVRYPFSAILRKGFHRL